MFKDNKMMEKFKRESSLRHQSERLLDNNIYQFHKKELNDKIKKAKMMDVEMRKKLIEKEKAKIKVKEEDTLKTKVSKGKNLRVLGSFGIGMVYYREVM